jgi:undecaprenyl pyrophosphate synthase
MPPRKRTAKSALSTEHKDALAAGRREGHAVRRYLVALERNKPRRGRQVSAESLQERLSEVESRIAEADALQRVHLIQERRNLERRISNRSDEVEDDMEALEDAFVEVAAAYGERKGIDYATWREAGVPAEVLQRAGVHWSRRG